MLLLELIKKHWKALLVLLAIVGSGLTGYHYGHQSAASGVQVVTTTDTQSKTTDDKKVNVDSKKTTTDNKTVVIDKKPDGEVITTIKDNKVTQTDKDKTVTDDKQSETASKTTTTQTPVTASADPYRPNYSLGLEWSPYFANPEKMNEYQVDIGYRAVGNLWVTALFNIETHQAGVGVRIDF